MPRSLVLVLVLGLAVAATSAYARPSPSRPLSGQVLDQRYEQPVPSVTVRLEGAGPLATTDEHGRFLLDEAPAGNLTLIVEGPTIEPGRFELDTRERSEPILLRVSYVESADDTVVVQGKRSRSPTASSHRVTAMELAAVPRRSAEDALRLVPGLTLVQHGSEGKGHQFFMRGFDAIHGADFELTVEGIPVNEWSNIHAQGYVDLGFVIPEAIQAVDVTKGPFALDQGAFAMAGSADYQLGIPADDQGARVGYTLGTTARQRTFATYSPKGRDGEEFLALEALHDGGFGPNRELQRGAALGRVRLLDSRAGGTLSLLGGAHLARFDLPGLVRDDDVEAGRIGFLDAYDHGAHGLSGRGLAAFHYDLDREPHRLRATLYGSYRKLELLENYTGFLLDPVRGDRRHQVQHTWSLGLSARHEAPVHETLAIRTGIGWRGDLLDQYQDHVDQRAEPFERQRDLVGEQGLAHALAGLHWTPVPPLRLDAGARADLAHVSVHDQRTSEPGGSGTKSAISPRASLSWQVVLPLRLFAAYGHGLRPPEARAFTSFEPAREGMGEDRYDGGEPAMTVAEAAEVGARWHPSRYFGTCVSGFITYIASESVFDHVSGVNLELNSTRRLGGELVVRSNPLDGLHLSADVTFVDARFVDSDNPVPLAPWLVGGAGAILAHSSGWRGGLRLLALAPRHLPHGARGATLVRVDATAGYHWQWLRVALELENLLGQELREGEYHFASSWRTSEPPSDIPVLHYAAGPPFNARLTVAAVF